MGCRGFKVYCHKGRYFLYYNHYDSEPWYFGLRVLREIPRGVSKEKFNEWVKLTREDLDAKAEKPDEEFIEDEQPQKGTFLDNYDLRNRLGRSHLLRRLSAPISFGQYAARQCVR